MWRGQTGKVKWGIGDPEFTVGGSGLKLGFRSLFGLESEVRVIVNPKWCFYLQQFEKIWKWGILYKIHIFEAYPICSTEPSPFNNL